MALKSLHTLISLFWAPHYENPSSTPYIKGKLHSVMTNLKAKQSQGAKGTDSKKVLQIGKLNFEHECLCTCECA